MHVHLCNLVTLCSWVLKTFPWEYHFRSYTRGKCVAADSHGYLVTATGIWFPIIPEGVQIMHAGMHNTPAGTEYIPMGIQIVPAYKYLSCRVNITCK